MMRFRFPWPGAFLLCVAPLIRAQVPAQSTHDLVKDVVYNELAERRSISLWQYRVEKRVASQTTVEQEIETVAGPVFRVFSRQGVLLDAAAQKKESDRLNNLVHSPGEQARMKQDHEAEEQRLERLIAAMPDAFVYTYDGEVEGNLRLLFHPNPAYNPQTYEARVYHALAGEIWVDKRLKRLVKVDGHIESQIDFGYGFLGRIEKAGTFQIGRQPASSERWKTNVIDVHVSGRMLFFKGISKDERLVREHFEPVASTTSVQDAVTMLNRVPSP